MYTGSLKFKMEAKSLIHKQALKNCSMLNFDIYTGSQGERSVLIIYTFPTFCFFLLATSKLEDTPLSKASFLQICAKSC